MTEHANRTGADTVDGVVAALAHGDVRVVDLTHELSPSTPVIQLPPQFEPSARFELRELSRYDDRGPFSYKNAYTTGEHVGTHFDAPIHWITGRDGASVDQIPMGALIAPALVIDKTREAELDPRWWLTVDDVHAFEDEHGKLASGSWLLLRTGWSQRHHSDEEFLNDSVWPGPDVECARYLAESGIVGFGTEAVGIDHGGGGAVTPPFPVHHYLLGAGKFGLASLANLDQLPVTGSLLVAAPLRIAGGSGSSMRAFALVPRA
jgi:kynurenine formamidase